MIISSGEYELTDAATIAIDASFGSCFRVTLTASRTMGAPANPSHAQVMVLRIIQGGSGSYTLSWNAAFAFSSDLPAPTLSTTVGKYDVLGFLYNGTLSKWLYVAEVKGF